MEPNTPNLPQPGQPITVEAVDELGRRAVFEGLVRRADSSGVAMSLAPRAGAVEVLAQGIRALVRFADQAGLHFFEASVVEATAGERLEVVLDAPSGVRTNQRRRFMRLRMRRPITCARLDEQGEPLERCMANTLEVGGNGAGIIADRPFHPGERVRFELDLGAWGRCSGLATVKRSVLALTAEGAEYRVALQFCEVGSRAQALILTYLLAARRQ